ncbi:MULTISPECIES: LysR substrate-binding domain-containing protein [unclassified Neptuniibacter]|uniref:LysR substrate-binding domain-containing protein n=1 Tax=unclassified Neptuniibacter TaxID=2630693 RepID=UPI0025D79147|nr:MULTISPECIES: LysR substrate-binding domain-containing protein [unclassified Neptuniibacter]|tara:strand:- start:5790 stop:6770 length:981 start_codon:yes stop_codon:yes gene_type:complete
MSRDPSLNGMIYFEAVARHGKVARAAEELNVSPSAVSQQLKLLEEMLGVGLFKRDKRQLSLTLEGERLFMACSSAFGILKNARRVISRKRNSHQLIVKVIPSFAVRWLGPRLHSFIEQYPEWDLRIDATPDPTNFDREVVDFDIRYGPSDWPGLYCLPVLHDYVLPMCSPEYREYLFSLGSTMEAQLQEARLVDSVKAMLQWEAWLARQRLSRNSNVPALRFDRSSMAIQQAVNGVGLVLESTTLAIDELRSGKLVPAFPEAGSIKLPAYWVVSPSRHQSRKLYQLFTAWLQEEAKVHQEVVLTTLASLDVPVIKDQAIDELLDPH